MLNLWCHFSHQLSLKMVNTEAHATDWSIRIISADQAAACPWRQVLKTSSDGSHYVQDFKQNVIVNKNVNVRELA
jgi:hypothetical protein